MISDLPYASEWDQWSRGNEGTDAAIQELFHNPSTDEKNVDITSVTKAYHNYKKEYVKHLSFNPKEENLSKVISSDQSLSNWFQLLCWSMPRCRQCTSTLTRQLMMRLRGT